MGRVVVLGGYGLIGAACMRALRRAGHEVVGVGRSARSARRLGPGFDWIIRDLTRLEVADWRALLEGAEAVVNASGALQDGSDDDLQAIHVTAVRRMVAALEGRPARIVQISAAGVSAEASTAFLRTKAAGDALIAAGARDWVILRPVLVIAAEAYGGTALLRAAAALPLTAPRVLPRSSVRTVHVEDVAAAVVLAVGGGVPSGLVADLSEAEGRSLPDLVDRIRGWLGHAPARFRPAFPGALLSLVARGADLLGHLGWRSPLRTTAVRALADGIDGDPRAWTEATGMVCRPLAETLASLPATRQDRLFARAYLALPLAIGALALFWIVSGAIGLARATEAAAVLPAAGAAGVPVVVACALADILLGGAVLVRRWTRAAALGMAGLSAAYLAGGALLAPGLWADPLGPMVKVIPATVLALLVWLLVDDR